MKVATVVPTRIYIQLAAITEKEESRFFGKPGIFPPFGKLMNRRQMLLNLLYAI